MRKHNHIGANSIDYLAAKSRLNAVNPALKAACAVCALTICVASKSAITPAIILVSTSAITLFMGKTDFRAYFKLLLAPIAFIVVGGFVILIDFSKLPIGLINMPLFGSYVIITAQNISDAVLVCARAMGAISCLYALSLSTKANELISVLKSIHIPSIVIELMTLIYRYIFILMETQGRLSVAAQARLGNANTITKIKTICRTSTVLLALSFRKAGDSFDAMQSRGYTGELIFLEEKKSVRMAHVVFAATYVTAAALLLIGGV